jgi:hypothetical protein
MEHRRLLPRDWLHDALTYAVFADYRPDQPHQPLLATLAANTRSKPQRYQRPLSGNTPLLLPLMRTTPTQQLQYQNNTASLSFRAPFFPAFYVNALTTTTGDERRPLAACAANAPSDFICLPSLLGGAQVLIVDGNELLTYTHEAAATTAYTKVGIARNFRASRRPTAADS